MKRRTGLVSNSSSSSFTCDVCGQTESGMDCTPSDFDMIQCAAGHCFCRNHEIKLSDEVAKVLVQRALDKDYLSTVDHDEAEKRLAEGRVNAEWASRLDEDSLYGEEAEYEWPIELCPICQLKSFTDSDLISFLLTDAGKTRDQVENQIRENYNNLAELHEALK